MEKLKLFFQSILTIGTDSNNSLRNNGVISLINISCLFIIIMLLGSITMGLAIESKTYSLTIDLLALLFIPIPLILNYYKRTELSKFFIITILNLLIAVFLYLFQGSVIKFTVIIPILFVLIFFSAENKWKRIIPLILIYSYLIYFEIRDYSHTINYTDINLSGKYYDTFSYFAFIVLFTLAQYYFGSILQKTELDLLVYKEIFNNAPVGIGITKPNGEYFNQNKAHEKLLGYSIEELKGQTPAMHMGEDAFKETGQIVKKKGFYNGEIVSNNKNGLKYIDLLVFPIIGRASKPEYLIGIKRDITEKRANELLIKNQNEELQKLSADKDRFISILAHDLRNPINGILGLSKMISENIRLYDLDELEKQITTIYQATQQASILLENTLLWAKMQSGKLAFNPKWVDLETCCKIIIENHKQSIENKSLSIETDFLKDQKIYADENMLNVVIRNLLSNAIKFTNNHGKILLECKNTHNHSIFSVSDNGVGINKQNIQSLFELSNSCSTMGTNGEKGTGIGLLLCKEMLEKHNGKIWVESTESEGSTFFISIPMSDQQITDK